MTSSDHTTPSRLLSTANMSCSADIPLRTRFEESKQWAWLPPRDVLVFGETVMTQMFSRVQSTHLRACNRGNHDRQAYLLGVSVVCARSQAMPGGACTLGMHLIATGQRCTVSFKEQVGVPVWHWNRGYGGDTGVNPKEHTPEPRPVLLANV